MRKTDKKAAPRRDVHVELDVSLAERIQEIAAREDRSFSRQLSRLLETHPDLKRAGQGA